MLVQISYLAVSYTHLDVYKRQGAVSAGGFILKLLVSILAAGLGFTVVKLLLMFSGRLKRPPKKKQQQIAPQLFNDFNDEDDPGFIEYKG